MTYSPAILNLKKEIAEVVRYHNGTISCIVLLIESWFIQEKRIEAANSLKLDDSPLPVQSSKASSLQPHRDESRPSSLPKNVAQQVSTDKAFTGEPATTNESRFSKKRKFSVLKSDTPSSPSKLSLEELFAEDF